MKPYAFYIYISPEIFAYILWCVFDLKNSDFVLESYSLLIAKDPFLSFVRGMSV